MNDVKTVDALMKARVRQQIALAKATGADGKGKNPNNIYVLAKVLLAHVEELTRERSSGWLYHSDDGPEWSASHPVESGEVPDARDVREATALELVKAYRDVCDAYQEGVTSEAKAHARATKAESERDEIAERLDRYDAPTHDGDAPLSLAGRLDALEAANAEGFRAANAAIDGWKSALAEAVKVLGPFAATADVLGSTKDAAIWAGQKPAPPITFGHLRAARAFIDKHAETAGKVEAEPEPPTVPETPRHADALQWRVGERIADEVEKALHGRQTNCEQAAADILGMVRKGSAA